MKYNDVMGVMKNSQSTDETRLHLNGVFFNHKQKELVSTDSHRLTNIPMDKCEFSVKSDEGFILSPDFINILMPINL